MPEPAPPATASFPRGGRPTRTTTRVEADPETNRHRDDADPALTGRVDGSARTMRALPGNLRSPALARALVAEALLDFPDDTVDTAVLLVSEVVTNAVQHAEGNPLILGVSSAPALVVTVEDTSPEPPAHGAAALDAENGRGLELVDALATAWGWHRSSAGKVVWFELGLI